MQIPLEITFHRMEPSEAVEAKIRDKAAGLERFYDRILRCRVVVEAPHGHHHQGRLYHVGIHLSVPDGELAISRDHHDVQAHEDLYVAIRDAFDAARRRLEDFARRRRGKVKSHNPQSHGRVSMLVPEQDYGKIETAEGRLVYFHRNSVLDGGFERLTVGSEVRFAEEQGDQGPQASTVRIVGKHQVAG